MKVSPLLVASVVAIMLLFPLGAAQQEQIEPDAAAQAGQGCLRQCTPADVNENMPRTGTDSAMTILYGHFQDILNRAPLNTQPPSEAEHDLARGFLMPVVSTYTGTDADAHFENNWFNMFSSPGFVEIVDGEWRTHQEPGLAESVEIKGNEMMLYFYLSAYPVPSESAQTSPLGGNVIDVMPKVGIYARMETGRHPLSSRSVVIAEGDTGTGDTALLPTDARRTTLITAPGMDNIYEFALPMEVRNPTIPSIWEGHEGYIVSINPYQIKENLAGDGAWQFMQADWRVHAGPSTPPRIVLEVGNPIVTKAASLTVFNQAMFVRWSFTSPWGSYDYDDPSLKIEVTGPSTIPADLVRLVIMRRSVDHDGHFKPVNVTWRFDYQRANLQDGEYSVKMSILNLQRSYMIEEKLTFRIVNGQPTDLQIIGGLDDDPTPQQAPEESPAFEFIGLLIATIVGVGLVRHRRRD